MLNISEFVKQFNYVQLQGIIVKFKIKVMFFNPVSHFFTCYSLHSLFRPSVGQPFLHDRTNRLLAVDGLRFGLLQLGRGFGLAAESVEERPRERNLPVDLQNFASMRSQCRGFVSLVTVRQQTTEDFFGQSRSEIKMLPVFKTNIRR